MSKKYNDQQKVIIKKCHICGHINYSKIELEKCSQCRKSFLPSSYFTKIHSSSAKEFEDLFAHADDISEKLLIKGIHVIW